MAKSNEPVLNTCLKLQIPKVDNINIDSHCIKPIGYAQTPFKEKFGIPRQPRLCAAKGYIKLVGEANQQACIADIEQHSHIWLLFLFNKNLSQGWKASVRPPRLGGNKKTGVFASRSTFRPNAMGMSSVKLLGKEKIAEHWCLHVEGLDLLDQTPIVDIKPYIPYSDSILEAESQMAENAPESLLTVAFTEKAEQQLLTAQTEHLDLPSLITQILSQDPRPAYKIGTEDDKTYSMSLYHYNISWKVKHSVCWVTSIY